MTEERAPCDEHGAKKNCIYRRSDDRGPMYEPHVGLRPRPTTRATMRELEREHPGWLLLILIAAAVGFGVVMCLTIAWMP